MSSARSLEAELQAHSDARIAEWRRRSGREEIGATRERLRAALLEGGVATATVLSRATGRHVTVRFVCKARRPGGGWVSRAESAGRVGLQDPGVMLFASDPTSAYGDDRIGSYNPARHRWRSAPSANKPHTWAARHLLGWALGDYPLEEQAEVKMRNECARCGRPLTDPESIDRGLGPECAGRRTRSRAAERRTA